MTSADRLVLATRNQHKVVELERILVDVGAGLHVVGIDGFDGVPEVAETGETFAANAALKAVAVAAATGLPAIGDDSGLCVDALNGMPGIFSARWSGGHGDDAANVALLLAQLADVPDERRAAHFVCAAVLAWPDGRTVAAEGRLAGHLVRSPRGDGGFGYDPVFVPDNAGDASLAGGTLAEIPATAKDAISHRGRALRALVAAPGFIVANR